MDFDDLIASTEGTGPLANKTMLDVVRMATTSSVRRRRWRRRPLPARPLSDRASVSAVSSARLRRCPPAPDGMNDTSFSAVQWQIGAVVNRDFLKMGWDMCKQALGALYGDWGTVALTEEHIMEPLPTLPMPVNPLPIFAGMLGVKSAQWRLCGTDSPPPSNLLCTTPQRCSAPPPSVLSLARSRHPHPPLPRGGVSLTPPLFVLSARGVSQAWTCPSSSRTSRSLRSWWA